MATRKIGTRGKPTSPLHLGILDPEQILNEARKIQRSHSFPSLYTFDHFDLESPFVHSEEKKQSLLWSTPSIPISSFQVFTNP